MVEIEGGLRKRPALLYSEVRAQLGRLRYREGQTYAVQAGRGKPGLLFRTEGENIRSFTPGDDVFTVIALADSFIPARIRLLSIRREDVRKISEADAFAEGFGSANAFLEVWTRMYDKWAWKRRPDLQSLDLDLDYQTWRESLAKRPIERYRAWVLTFELVKENENGPATSQADCDANPTDQFDGQPVRSGEPDADQPTIQAYD